MVTILLQHRSQRDPVRASLTEAGVETRPIFYPVHTMPMYHSDKTNFPIAESIAARGINLPSWQGLAQADIHEIAAVIKGCLEGLP